MVVEGDVPDRGFARGGAGENDRKFGGEINRGLGDRRRPADRLPGGSRRPGLAGPALPLAVIAEPAALQDQRQAERLLGGADVVLVVDRGPARDLAAVRFDEALFDGAVLGDREGRSPRLELVAKLGKRLGGQVLEFVGGDIDRVGERLECVSIVLARAGESRRDPGRGRIEVGGDHMAVVAELRSGDGQHPAELAAADDADRGARGDGHPGVSATDFVWVSR